MKYGNGLDVSTTMPPGNVTACGNPGSGRKIEDHEQG